MVKNSYDDICSIINNEIGYNAAAVHIISGENLICIDIPSILNATLTREFINSLSGVNKEEVIDKVYLTYPSLRFFDKTQIINCEQEEVLDSVRHNDLDERVKLVEQEKIVQEDIDVKICKRIELENGIEILNMLLRKKYICYSKRGVLINLNSCFDKPLDGYLEELVMGISDINSAKQVLYEIMRKYPALKSYAINYNNTSLTNNNKDVVIENPQFTQEQLMYIAEYKVTLETVNKALLKPLYFNNKCLLSFKIKEVTGKKKNKRTVEKEVELNNKCQGIFRNIKDDFSLYHFLMVLNESTNEIVRTKPPVICGEYIYIKDHGYLLSNIFLQRLLSLNSNFTKELIRYNDKGIYIKNNMVSEQVLNKLYRVSNNVYLEEAKRTDMLKIITQFYGIRNEDFAFTGSTELISKSEKLLEDALLVIESPVKTLIKSKIKVIEDLNKYKDFFNIQSINNIVKYKNNLDLNNLAIDTVEKDMYMSNIDIKHMLFTVNAHEIDGTVTSEVKYNNSFIYDINQLVPYMVNKSVTNLRKLKKFCKDIREAISYKIMESVENSQIYKEFDKKELSKKLKDIEMFSASNIKITKDNIKVLDNEYNSVQLTYEIYKAIADETYKYLIAVYNNKVIDWALRIEARKDVKKLMEIDEYAAALYLISETPLKGMTTYVDILAGNCTSSKNRRDYSSLKIYGHLSGLKKVEIEDVICKLIGYGVLGKSRRRASFGDYTAIVTTNRFSNEMVKDFEDKLYGRTVSKANLCDAEEENNVKRSYIEHFSLDVDEVLKELLDPKIIPINLNKKKKVKDTCKDPAKVVKTRKVAMKKEMKSEPLVQKEVDIMSLLGIVKGDKNIKTTIKSYKVSEVKLEDIKSICKYAAENNNFIMSNWKVISLIIPKLEQNALTFLSLQYNLNKKPSIKTILEIEEKKEVI